MIFNLRNDKWIVINRLYLNSLHNFMRVFSLTSIEKRTKIINMIITVTKANAMAIIVFLYAGTFLTDKLNLGKMIYFIRAGIMPNSLDAFRRVLTHRIVLF